MTDFFSVLQRAVATLPDGSGPQRRQVYEKARKALLKQLQSFDPPLPSSDVTAQRLALEDAIRKIENEIARANRTKRAVQSALPAGAAGTAPMRPSADGNLQLPRETEAERDVRRRAEADKSRAERVAMLKTAVSDATAPVAAAAALPVPVPTLVMAAPGPLVATAPVINADMADDHEGSFLDGDSDAEPAAVPARRRGGRAEPIFEPAATDDAEYEEVVDAEVVDDGVATAAVTEDRGEARRRRRAEERALKAERRAERTGRRRNAAAAIPSTASEGRARSIVARVALPFAVLVLLVGASYAAFTQRERLMAVIDSVGGADPVRAPIASAGPAVEKNEERLAVDGEETRTVATTPVRLRGAHEPPVDAAEGGTGNEDAVEGAPGSGDEIDAAAGDEGAADASGDEGAADASGDEGAADASGDGAADQPADAPAQFAAVEPATAPTSEAEAAARTITPAGADFTGKNTQQAMLYEEAAHAGEQGSAVRGQVEWSMVQQSVGGSDPEPVVRAVTTVADRQMTATMTIRENRDRGLPASHLIEIAFELPEGFEGGVKNVPGVIMKETEQSRGEPLRGAAARVSAGLFWIALSEDPADREHNLDLLKDRDWIDVPILYESGRRAILTLRKGSDGFQSVNAAIARWSNG